MSGGSLIYTLLPPTLDALKYAWIVFLFVFYALVALIMTNTVSIFFVLFWESTDLEENLQKRIKSFPK